MQFLRRTCQNEVELVRKGVESMLNSILLRHKELSSHERRKIEGEAMNAKSHTEKEAAARVKECEQELSRRLQEMEAACEKRLREGARELLESEEERNGLREQNAAFGEKVLAL